MIKKNHIHNTGILNRKSETKKKPNCSIYHKLCSLIWKQTYWQQLLPVGFNGLTAFCAFLLIRRQTFKYR